MWQQSILDSIGQTPLVELTDFGREVAPTLLAKVEYFNPGQSVKDRVALGMIQAAERVGALKPGGTVVEGTSGNTGLGIALVAAQKGYRCIFTMKDKTSPEKIALLEALGAEVHLCSSKVPAEHPDSYYSRAAQLAREIPGAVHLNQYDNPANPQAHYESLGPEIWRQTGGQLTHLVVCMGTCGTLCGVARYLKEQNPAIRTIGADAYGSLLQHLHATGEVDMKEVYPYLTEAVGRDNVPGVYNGSVIDEVIKVTDRDGILTARALAKRESLLVGWSSGTAMAAALQLAPTLGPDDLVVVLMPDHGSRYLGKLYNDHWLLQHGLMTAEELGKTPLAVAS